MSAAQYQFNFNGSSNTGTLTWNSNGSLGSLAISDALNSSNTQNCGYAHDDLSRIASVSCGSTWGQTFSFDPFGNISKSGSISFAGLYDTSTNRLTNMGKSYDSNGNLTGISSDATYSYSWDSEGKPVSITRSGSTVNLTYDALGRMVEQNRGGSYTQIVYGPGGSKLALMNGSTLQKAFVPLPAGAQAVYNGSGLAYYRHADWLGTSRLASTPSRTLYYDGAYAPYGESYSETGSTDRDFTGQNQDTHAGLYDFMYREYHPVSGRWSSPDPAGLAAVDPSNPQSWNRYAYVMNRPAVLVDPLGKNAANPGYCDAENASCDGGSGGGGFGGGGGGFGPAAYEVWAVGLNQYLAMVNISILNAAARRIAENAARAFLGILEGDNGCSSYFNNAVESFSEGFDSLAAPIFQSVNIRLNTAQDAAIGAQTKQGAGVNAVIFLNPVGPFYRAFGNVDGQNRTLTVGPYTGGTVRAQVTILAHEFAHNVNAIPSDTGNREQSVANTRTIVSNCGTAINRVRN